MKRHTLPQPLPFIFLLVLSSSLAFSQNFTGGFNFYLPPRDTGSTRFIPQFPRTPLTDQDFVSIDADGHFSVRGKAIRFFGVNFCQQCAFPTESKAWFIAGRVRKMGFNLIRFHQIDNTFCVSPYSLFRQGGTTRQLDPVALDRIDNILAELKKNGIYADINLHATRAFNRLDGLPDADSLQEFGKAINYFDPQVLTLHKEFAQQILTHVSPYTGKSLANDPMMAMVEITNENLLYGAYWRFGRLKPFAAGGMLTTRHVRMLDSLWMLFLKSRYANTSSLAASWNAGATSPNAKNLVVNGSFEDNASMTPWSFNTDPVLGYMLRDSTTCYSGKYSAKIAVIKVDGTDWHVQLLQQGLLVKKDSAYLISFAARADSTRPIRLALQRVGGAWTVYWQSTVLLQPQWNKYTLFALASETTDSAMFQFELGAQVGTYLLDDLSISSAARGGLFPDESFESSNIRRIDYSACPLFSEQRVRDMSTFYLKLQDDYFAQMRTYLRDTLRVRVPIVGTAFNNVLADVAAQSKLDYMDNHEYWDSSGDVNAPDWFVSNTPMVQATDGGTVSRLMAAVPMKGKPYTIGEYNHLFPNRFQSEALVFLSGYGSFHDADALMLYDYSILDDWEPDLITGGTPQVEIHRNSALMALVPSCAAAYRSGMIEKARQQLVVNYAPDDYLTYPQRDVGDWKGPVFFDRKLALKYAIRTGSFLSNTSFNPLSLPPVPTNPYVTDTKEITWNTDGLLTVATGRFVGATGLLNNFVNQSAGPLAIKAASGFGTLTWVSLTTDSLQKAPLSLLTISTRVQNTGMIWDGTTSIRNWGTSPTQVEPVNLSLQLTMLADSIRVYPLDPYGRETNGFSAYQPTLANTFAIAIDQNRLQSMWFGIQAFKGNLRPSFVAKMRDTTIAQNQILGFTYTATDLYRDSLKYTLVNPPSGATVTPSGVFSWTPSYTQSGVFFIVAVVSKTYGSFTDTARATITVMRVSAKPSFVAKLRDTTIAQNTTLSFTYLATDPNGDSLKYTAVTLPQGATFTGTVFSWKPAYTQAGAFPMMVVVSKKSLAAYADTARATVTVTKVNQKPVLNLQTPAAGTLTTLARNKSQTFAVSVTDPNGDPLTYTWKGNGGVVKTGKDSSYTQSFVDPHNTPEWVRVIWSKPNGVMPDSVTWNFVITLVSMDENVIPTEFALAQNYPNPFNPSTNIQFDLPKSASVTLEIYSILGIRVRTLAKAEVMNAGRYTAAWDGRDEGAVNVATGVYICRITAGDFHASKKLALVR